MFGLKERGDKLCVFKVVGNREANTLLPIIQNHVKPGTIIMSDCWSAYNKISSLGYEHHTVNHTYHFVDPSSIDKQFKIHTNGIESIWKDVKMNLKRMAGIKRGNIQSYLNEFIWRLAFIYKD